MNRNIWIMQRLLCSLNFVRASSDGRPPLYYLFVLYDGIFTGKRRPWEWPSVDRPIDYTGAGLLLLLDIRSRPVCMTSAWRRRSETVWLIPRQRTVPFQRMMIIIIMYYYYYLLYYVLFLIMVFAIKHVKYL